MSKGNARTSFAAAQLLGIVAWLLRRGQPAPFEEIAEAFPDYFAGTVASCDRKWTRAKRLLQAAGVELAFVDWPEPGYVLCARHFHMTPRHSKAALRLLEHAVPVDSGDVVAAHAWRKLVAFTGLEAPAWFEVLPADPGTDLESTVRQALVLAPYLLAQCDATSAKVERFAGLAPRQVASVVDALSAVTVPPTPTDGRDVDFAFVPRSLDVAIAPPQFGQVPKLTTRESACLATLLNREGRSFDGERWLAALTIAPPEPSTWFFQRALTSAPRTDATSDDSVETPVVPGWQDEHPIVVADGVVARPSATPCWRAVPATSRLGID